VPSRVAARRKAVLARLLVATGDPWGARQLIGPPPYDDVEIVAAATQACVALGDLPAAGRLLDAWPRDPEPGTRIQHLLWSCIVDHVGVGGGESDPRLSEALAIGERDGHVRVFLDAGPHSTDLVRARYHREPNPYLRRLVDASRARRPASPRTVPELVEQLTGRELEALNHLATTLDNAEIAAEMGVSPNTLKTHVRSVYRKLGVDRRRSAVAEAERLHLL
jgi:LuxR family maltose regulon positive regulatory protein